MTTRLEPFEPARPPDAVPRRRLGQLQVQAITAVAAGLIAAIALTAFTGTVRRHTLAQVTASNHGSPATALVMGFIVTFAWVTALAFVVFVLWAAGRRRARVPR